MMIKYGADIKIKAAELRKIGYSLGRMVKELGVPKSTIHFWLRGNKRPEKFTRRDRLRWIKEIQPLGALANKRKHEKMIEAVKGEVGKELKYIQIGGELKKSALALLYWAEGSKTGGTVQFVNTDPRLVLLFLTLLRQCYKILEDKLRVRLHLHEYHDEKNIKDFWSKLLKIPKKQFSKTYFKNRGKEKTFRRNFGGICFVRYNDTVLKEKILQYAYCLSRKITGEINVPVA